MHPCGPPLGLRALAVPKPPEQAASSSWTSGPGPQALDPRRAQRTLLEAWFPAPSSLLARDQGFQHATLPLAGYQPYEDSSAGQPVAPLEISTTTRSTLRVLKSAAPTSRTRTTARTTSALRRGPSAQQVRARTRWGARPRLHHARLRHARLQLHRAAPLSRLALLAEIGTPARLRQASVPAFIPRCTGAVSTSQERSFHATSAAGG